MNSSQCDQFLGIFICYRKCQCALNNFVKYVQAMTLAEMLLLLSAIQTHHIINQTFIASESVDI